MLAVKFGVKLHGVLVRPAAVKITRWGRRAASSAAQRPDPVIME